VSSPASRSNVWAITCYFNPIGYRRRLDNYRLFRERLKMPLVTVELSLNGDYHLSSGDADILVPIQGHDLLWQKERLFNIGLRFVPRQCDTIAWLDCDVIFENDDWSDRASSLLENCKIVTPFKCMYELPKDTLPEQDGSRTLPRYSFMYAVSDGLIPQEYLRGDVRANQRISTGRAAVARRTLLENHGFYDSCVMGSGSRAMLCAALGRFDDAIQYLKMSPLWARHYLAWAHPFFDSVNGSVTYLNENVFHLWHGELEDRKYIERHGLLKEADFDPVKDIALDENGVWQWSRPQSEMKEYFWRYFTGRREDG
jgi:hypothetical protein